jgi:tartrate-resistant acid phosphatase type 5
MLNIIFSLLDLHPRKSSTRGRNRSLHIEPLETREMLSATRFAVIGDFGSAGTEERDVAALVKSWNPDIILTVGDNNYSTGSAATIDANIGQYYHDFISPYLGSYGSGAPTNRFFPTLGNHDWGDFYPNPTGDQPYLDYFTLPGNERYYTFTQGPVQFFAIDSDGNEPDGILSTSTQAKWLQAQLAASTATYKLVYFHHPPYTSHASSEEFEARWPYQAWGATAVLTGHAHNYERLIEDNNFPYFVNGVGGRGLDPFDTIETGSQVRYNADFGAMLVNADQNQMQFQFITRTGDVIDTYTIPAPLPQVSTTLIPSGAVWKYLDNGSNQGTAWQGTSFNDSAWSSGPAQLGYGDGDEQTIVGYGGNSSSKFVTTYFRRSFVVSDPSVAANGLTLNLLRDDGAVVYLNGSEAFRSNMPTGTIGYQTLASGPVTGSDESAWYSFSFNSSLLVAGTNVLAVEIHQSDPASSDVSFDLSLIGSQILAPNTASSLLLAGFPSSIQAGVAANFTVTALDGFGNTATAYRGTIHFSSSDAQAVLPGDYTFTAADNGTHAFSATLKTAGSQTLLATDSGSSTVTSSQTITQPLPGDFNISGAVETADYIVWRKGLGTASTDTDYNTWRLHFGEIAGAGTESGFLTQLQSSVIQSYSLAALNAVGKAANANSGTAQIASSGHRASLSSGNGVHTLSATLKRADSRRLSAANFATSSIQGTQTIMVQAAAASSLRVVGFPSPVKAGASKTFKVVVVDAYGNIVTNYRGTIHFSSTDNRAVLPANYTFTSVDNGVHTFKATLKTVGLQSLIATDKLTSSITGSQAIMVTK